jgi:hypothetical protein
LKPLKNNKLPLSYSKGYTFGWFLFLLGIERLAFTTWILFYVNSMVNISFSRDISLWMKISLFFSFTLWLYILWMLEIYIILAVTHIIYFSILVLKNNKGKYERKIALFSLCNLLLIIIIFWFMLFSGLSAAFHF